MVPGSGAGHELAAYLGEITGGSFAVEKVSRVADIDRDRPAIVLGGLARESGVSMEKRSRAKDGFRYKVVGTKLLIVGESPQGVYHGAFDLLEELGCGWYTPGKVGDVVPGTRTLTLPDDLDHSEVSDSVNRRFWYGGGGNGKTRSNRALGHWLSRNKADLERGSWRHAWGGLVRKERYFKDHPEYFSLNRGRRTAKQICTTNPEVIRIAADTLMAQMSSSSDLVFPAGPNDGGNLCECEECAKLHTPGYLEPSSGRPSHTSVVFRFASDIAEITSKRFPDRDLGILIYSEYSRVPAKIRRVNRNVFPMFAPIRRCRLHGPGNPLCSWNRLWQEEISGWADLTDKLGFYNYNLADTLVPFTKLDFYKRLVKQAHDLDIKELAWVSETIDSWAMHAPHMWLSARLSWDSRIDIDEELDRFFTGFYGASSRPMRRYWLRIDDAYATTDTHTGSQYGLHHVWTEGLLAQSRRNIEEAKRLTSNNREREAVAMAEAGLRCAELFTKIWNEIGSFDFLEAARTEKELEDHVSRMASRAARTGTDPRARDPRRPRPVCCLPVAMLTHRCLVVAIP